MTLSEEIQQRNITEVLHFTTNKGLVGILATGIVKSRRRLPAEDYLKYIVHNNALKRPEDATHFDKSHDWLDFINMSLSEINASYFRFSRAWDHNKDIWWAILSFSSEIVLHPDVWFATTNNGYSFCKRDTAESGFRSLFDTPIKRKTSWSAHRGSRAANLPTCEQAEVLYPGELPIRFLRRIYVRTGEDSDHVKGWLREFNISDIIVEVCHAKFIGVPN